MPDQHLGCICHVLLKSLSKAPTPLAATYVGDLQTFSLSRYYHKPPMLMVKIQYMADIQGPWVLALEDTESVHVCWSDSGKYYSVLRRGC